jgi:uncharacterized protein (DUF1778 family)
MKAYDEMAREAERLRKDQTELEGLTPVEARVARKPRAVFSLRLAPSELSRIAKAAKARGTSISDFVRLSALAAADGRLDVSSAERFSAIDKIRSHSADLQAAVEKLIASEQT